MYEPKPNEPGGDKPGDDKPGGDPTGNCKCINWPVKETPPEQPFRRFLLDVKEAIQGLPPDAIEKFETELKDAEKESQGIAGIVSKYKEFYDKQLDCKLAEAKNWKSEIARLLDGKIDDAAKTTITNFRNDHYEGEEKRICCDWLALRDAMNKLRDCLEQAKRTEEERKQDYEDFKGFQKTLSDRFDSLKTLFEDAKKLATEQRYRALFALSLEFDAIYDTLSLFRDWAYASKNCPKPPDDGDGQTGEPEPPTESGYVKPPPPEGGGYGEPSTTPTPTPPASDGDDQSADGLKDHWKPEEFKKRLTGYLRALVLAKYQRFRWQYEFQTKTAKVEKGGKDCADFRKERQKQFIDEADDIPTPAPTGGGSGEYGQKPPTGGYPETPPTGGYVPETPPTGGYPETPPAGGGYEEKPPAGNYPDKPTPPYGSHKDTPAPKPDTYRGRQEK
jgi:hypothetical protein